MKKIDGKGLRFNKGKPMLHMVPKSVKEAIAKVFEYGMTREKNPYPANNWRRGMKWTTVLDSAMRHLEAFNDPNTADVDTDSGLCHLWHAATNIAILIEYMQTCPELDDRYTEREEE